MLRLEKLFKTYKTGDQALKAVELEVPAGQVLALIGPSGAGKSTLIRCINQLEKHEQGDISVDGIALDGSRSALNAIRQRVGMVFQQFNLFPHLSVLDNLTLGPMRARSMSRLDAEKLAMQYLERVRIPEQTDKFPRQLSGGQQQRVAIARAIIGRPSLLLADEPTGNVDDQIAERLLYLFEELNRLGTTVLIATHNEHLIEQFKHPIIRLDEAQARLLSTDDEED